MKVLVIGGTGHVGNFLCPLLKERGHEVVIASRGTRALPDGIKSVVCDSGKVESLIPLREEGFDTVIDFPGTAKNVYEALGGYVNHIIACGSLWMLGEAPLVPTPEVKFGDSFIEGLNRRYDAIKYMMEDGKSKITAILPPNICGPGKIPIDGIGGRDINVHKAHKNGEKVYLPDGPQCLIEPCDASDIAMLFALCVEQPDKAAGEFFNVGSGTAMTVTEMIKTYAKIYGTEIPIEYVSWEKYKNEISPDIDYWWHFYAHMCPDISKAEKLLGFKPKYTSAQAMERAVKWMFDKGMFENL